MTIALVAAWVVVAAAEPAVHVPDGHLDVHQAFSSDTALLQHHRGYLDFLEGAPAIADAEAAWWGTAIVRDFGAAARQFNEALAEDAHTERLFDLFYDELARNGSLRRAVELLRRTEMGSAKEARPWAEAFEYLRANPDWVITLLEGGAQLERAPERAQPFLERVQGDPEFAAGFRRIFEGLTGNPLAYTHVFPWWERLANVDAAADGAYGRLAAHFIDHPHHFWVWHRRHLALARDAHARAWIRYWHRRIRRSAIEERDYLAYLRWLREHPERAAAIETAWHAKHGPAEAWPPKSAPPPLQPYRPTASEAVNTPETPAVPEPSAPTLARPKKPAIPYPKRPTRPHIERPAEVERDAGN